MKCFQNIALVGLVLMLCGGGGQPDPAPKKFTTSIGGFLGPSYRITLDNGVLIYKSSKTSSSLVDEAPEVRISPTTEQWKAFRRSLDELNVWTWKTNYTKTNVMDGTQWTLNVAFSDKALLSNGSNLYPKDFTNYLKAVQTLLGGRDFK